MIVVQAIAECDVCGFRFQQTFDDVTEAARTVEAADWEFHGGRNAAGEESRSRLLCNECVDDISEEGTG